MTSKTKRRQIVLAVCLTICVAALAGPTVAFQWEAHYVQFVPANEWGFRAYPYVLRIQNERGTHLVHLGVTQYMGCVRFTRLDPRRAPHHP